MAVGMRCAVEAPERSSVYAGRTCGFTTEILLALPTRDAER
jgi:hypothetical protein